MSEKYMTPDMMGYYVQSAGLLNAETANELFIPKSSGVTIETSKIGKVATIKITDQGNEHSISVSDGEDGLQGAQGVAGDGIANSIVHYQVSDSGTTIPTGSWLTDIPETSAGDYLWTRLTVNFTNNSSQELYSVSYHGDVGPQGETGVWGGVVCHEMNQTDETVTLNPNEDYFFPQMATLEITLAPSSKKSDEYMFQFTSGDVATTLTLPSDLKMPDGFQIEVNKMYEISIKNGVMLCGTVNV